MSKRINSAQAKRNWRIAEIRRLTNEGHNQSQIAKKLNISIKLVKVLEDLTKGN